MSPVKESINKNISIKCQISLTEALISTVKYNFLYFFHFWCVKYTKMPEQSIFFSVIFNIYFIFDCNLIYVPGRVHFPNFTKNWRVAHNAFSYFFTKIKDRENTLIIVVICAMPQLYSSLFLFLYYINSSTKRKINTFMITNNGTFNIR